MSGPDFFPVGILKNCKPELSYILACRWSLYLTMLGRSAGKSYCPVSLFSVVSKVFENLVNNRLVDHLEKYGFFSDF